MAKKKVGIKVPTANELAKRYGDMIITASDTKENGLWLPSTFFMLNYTFGGGIPFGKILEVAGEESSGKSLIAYNFAYATQQLGGHVIWVDAEQAWMNSWAQENGIDPAGVTVIRDTRIENIADALADLTIYWRSQLTHNEPILLVVDSIAAMDCADNIDSKMVDGKSEMGGRAKALYKFFRIRSELFYRLGITQIYINQLRTALNVGFGKDNTTTTGGAALKFYASIRAAFYAGKGITVKYRGKERKAGKLVTIRLIKNKVAPPRPTISKTPVYFNPKYHEVGFDRYFGLEDVFVENEIIEKSSGGIYKYKGKQLCRGEEKFQKLLEEDDTLRRRLLKAASINTISTTKKKLASLTENFYPIDGDVEYESFDDTEEYTEEGEEN
jgi:recombination protein RecA